MAGFLNIARWEGFKLRHRRMPWVLLAVLIAFTQLAVWGSFRNYNATMRSGGFVELPESVLAALPGARRGFRCNDLRTKPGEVLPPGVPQPAVALLLDQCEKQVAARFGLLLPKGSVSTALGVASSIGVVLLGVFTATAFGSEYGLGTLRPILLRGVGRKSFLGGKLLVLAASVTAALLLAAAAAGASGVLISGMAIPPATPVLPETTWSDVAISFARVWASLLAFLAIAGSITLLTRSTAAGLAVSLGLYLFEGLFIRLMTLAFSGFEAIGEYLPIHNINTLAGSSYNLAPIGPTGDTGATQAALVVGLYVLVFAGAAVAVFRERDVVGTSGG